MKVKSFKRYIQKEKSLGFINFLFLLLIFSLSSCLQNKTVKQKKSIATISCQVDSESDPVIAKKEGNFKAFKTNTPLLIDGCNKDSIWSKINWYDMNYIWMGEKVDAMDYNGKFKLAWDHQYLYVLVEAIDEYLNPTLKNGLENYWKGDYVEIFIDEDQSGGNHQYNHQAFAYHVSTEGDIIDKSISEETIFFNNHIDVKRSQEGDRYLWEMAIKLFNNQFDENTSNNIPIEIINQKSIGFSIAYGDNDGNNTRENFMGSKETHGINNDEGYINADVFGSIIFVEASNK